MKLGSQTGSVTNHIISRAVIGQPEPVVGMGCTLLGWTDRHAATITFVTIDRGRRILWVKEDRATVISGSAHNGTAQYAYERNPDANTAPPTYVENNR